MFCKLAKDHGFESYEGMLLNSYVVIYDHGVTWRATITPKGWMAWLDNTLNPLLGYFKTYEQASNLITAVFEERSNLEVNMH